MFEFYDKKGFAKMGYRTHLFEDGETVRIKETVKVVTVGHW
ncbi:hypothetical protein [Bacillus cereus]|nr:hypothetical protein [Bacillus cereus]